VSGVFTPTEDSQAVNVSNSSQRLALSSARSLRKALSFVKADTGDFYVYARFGDSTVTVSASDGYPVVVIGQATGVEKVIGIPSGVTHVALITGSGTPKNVQVTEGVLL
jgi:hypothetical protein